MRIADYKTTKEFILAAEIPTKTRTYKPVSHQQLMDLTLNSIEKSGFTLDKELYSSYNEGRVANGRYTISNVADSEMQLQIGWQNSYDKTASLKFAQVKSVLLAVVKGELPPRKSVVGASEKTVCDDCKRTKGEKKVRRFYRPFEIIQDSSRCLLEQGILCMGSATRSGCGVRCPNSNQGCRGCYGPAPAVKDHGAKFLSALASIIDSKDPKEIDEIVGRLPDFISFAYRFGLPASTLERSHQR